MKFQKLFLSFCLVTVSFLAACQNEPVYQFPSSSNILYYCDQSRQMAVSVGPNAQDAIVLYEGRNIRLPRLPADTEIYSDGVWTLLFNELGVAAFERYGVPVLTGCNSEEPDRPERSIQKKIFSGTYD